MIEISNLTVAYKKSPVLFDVNFSMPQGILAAVVGPNGAGKTTLIKSMLGLINPVAGRVKILDKAYPAYMQNIAYVPQRISIDWDFPIHVLDVVLMGCYRQLGWIKRPRKKDKQRALEALRLMEMIDYAHTPIGALSGGQQQRVFLARALVQEADLFLLDEPFVGVDATTEKAIIKLLKSLRDQHKTILVVHHDLQVLREYFDWVLILNKTVLTCGPIEESLKKEYIATAYQKENVNAFTSL